MKAKRLIPILMILLIGAVYSQTNLSASVTINNYPKAKPNDVAVIYGIIENTGSLVSNFSLKLEKQSQVACSVSPSSISNVAVGQKVIIKVTLYSESEGTYNISLIINQTHTQKDGNVTLYNTLIVRIIFLVDSNVETTKEKPPTIVLNPTETETESGGLSYWMIGMAGLIFFTVVVVAISLYDYYKKKVKTKV